MNVKAVPLLYFQIEKLIYADLATSLVRFAKSYLMFVYYIVHLLLLFNRMIILQIKQLADLAIKGVHNVLMKIAQLALNVKKSFI